ncbi:MAG: putative poly-gamma-glutamate synthesis protein, partial [Clostridia bacterium]|nr:putative poly-gamma-glutamate synthesis protein [Clostridia bacterium]
NGIDTIGAGNSLFEASKPIIMEKEGIRVGVYACAEHEFSIAGEGKPGANPFDPLESLDHISKLNKSCDYVIVLYHGGKEEYPYPTPNLQKACHAMVKKGADLILCQHSHCIGCYELYEKAYICYGQGNFLFDASEHELWKTGLLLEVILDKEKIKINPLPIVKYGNKVRLAGPEKQKKILASYTERSVRILQPYFIEKEFEKKSRLKLEEYMNVFYGGNYLRRICKKISRSKWSLRYSEKKLAAIENYIACEAHREMLLDGLKNYSKGRDQGENRKRFSENEIKANSKSGF